MSFVVGVDLDNSAEEALNKLLEMCDDVTPEIIQLTFPLGGKVARRSRDG